jgi:predicted metal-binding membrane protein
VYRPHGEAVAGVLILAAGLYELTPLKHACRRRCRAHVRSGLEFGGWCLGSSIGLMVMLVALGAMSVTWMVVVASLVAAQKLLPPRRVLDVPVALAIVGLGVALLV